jgi:hypothetical protein
VLMIHYWHWNGRSRNISHQYIKYYEVRTINVVKSTVKKMKQRLVCVSEIST